MKKLLPVVLVFTLCCSLITSCSGHSSSFPQDDPVFVDESEPWWNETIREKDDLPRAPGVFCFSQYLYCDGEIIITEYIAPATEFDTIEMTNVDGDLLGSVDVCAEMGAGSYDLTPMAWKDGDDYFTVITVYDDLNGDNIQKIYRLDFSGSCLEDTGELELPGTSGMMTGIKKVICKEEKKYTLLNVTNPAAGFSSNDIIVIEDSEGAHTITPDYGDNVTYSFILNMLEMDGTVFFVSSLSIGDRNLARVYRIDNETYNYEMVYETEDDHPFYGRYVDDYGILSSSTDTVELFDPVSREFTELLRFEDTYVNGIYYMNENYQVLYASDDRVILTTDKSSLGYGNGDPVTVVLDRADANPHAGKTVITVAYTQSTPSPGLYRAVAEFNRNSPDHFIRFDSKYYMWDYMREIGEFDNFTTESNNAIDQLIDVLSADIRNGDGPDIVITGQYSQMPRLISRGMLFDLTDSISGSSVLSSGNFFDFVTAPDYFDGKKYLLPYSVSYNGLMSRTEYLEDGSGGFSYDDYNAMVSNRLNGNNVMSNDRLYNLNTLFCSQSDLFFDEEGNLDLHNDAFTQLADYISQLPEAESDPVSMSMPRVGFASGFTYFYKLFGKYGVDYSITGLPSSDARSETVTPSAFGIVVSTPSYEACFSFIETVLSYEIQCEDLFGDPVNTDAVRHMEEDLRINGNIYNAESFVTDDGNWPTGIVDHYIDQISDARIVPPVDNGVLCIMDEEMPAYFTGQKSLDEVILIIENRVNNMLREDV